MCDDVSFKGRVGKKAIELITEGGPGCFGVLLLIGGMLLFVGYAVVYIFA